MSPFSLKILDGLEIGVVVLDNQWRFRAWNAWMERSSGLASGAVIGQSLDAVFPHLRDAGLGVAVESALQSGMASLLSDALNGALFPLRCADGRLLRHNVLISRFDDEAGGYCLLQIHDVTARRDGQTALRQSQERARTQLNEVEALYRTAPIGLGLFDRDLRFLRVNEMLADMNGASVEQHLGRTAWEVVPSLRELAEPMLRKVFETGEPLLGIDLQGTTAKQPGVQRNWIEDFYPLKSETGTVIAVGAIVREVTEQKRLEERERLLKHELQHRLKNMFAMVQGLSLQTARTASSVPQFMERFSGWLLALAAAQELLAQSYWEDTVTLRELATIALAPFTAADDRLTLSLDASAILADQASSLALVFHELATNATKYGALSNQTGRVTLTAMLKTVAAGPEVCLEWRETGGPTVAPPEHKGFGSLLLERVITGQCGGRVVMDWRKGGLVCRICLPAP